MVREAVRERQIWRRPQQAVRQVTRRVVQLVGQETTIGGRPRPVVQPGGQEVVHGGRPQQVVQLGGQEAAHGRRPGMAGRQECQRMELAHRWASCTSKAVLVRDIRSCSLYE